MSSSSSLPTLASSGYSLLGIHVLFNYGLILLSLLFLSCLLVIQSLLYLKKNVGCWPSIICFDYFLLHTSLLVSSQLIFYWLVSSILDHLVSIVSYRLSWISQIVLSLLSCIVSSLIISSWIVSALLYRLVAISFI